VLPVPGQRVTYNARGIRLDDLARYLALQSGTSVVVDQASANTELTVVLDDVPWDQAMRVVARLAGVEVHRLGDVWLLGARRNEDNSAKIVQLRSASAEAAIDAISKGTNAVAIPVGPQRVVLSGSSSEISKAEALAEELNGAPNRQWAVQLNLISFSKRDLRELGLDVRPAFGANGGLRLPGGFDGSAQAQLSVALKAARERSSVRVEGQPFFLMLDGASSKFVRGGRVPIPKTAVSNQGTVTVTGFEYVQTGTTVSVGLREVGEDECQLNLQISLSELQEVTSSGAPVTSERNLSSMVICRHQGTYLVGSFDLQSERASGGTWSNWGGAKDKSVEVLQVWARVASTDGGPITGG